MTTYVLIHGAYQGGWIWRDVAAALRAEGHLVLAPTLDGCAERQHQLRPGITTETQAAELASLLFPGGRVLLAPIRVICQGRRDE